MKEFEEFERINEMKVCDKRNHEIHQIHKSGVLKRLFSWFIKCNSVTLKKILRARKIFTKEGNSI